MVGGQIKVDVTWREKLAKDIVIKVFLWVLTLEKALKLHRALGLMLEKRESAVFQLGERGHVLVLGKKAQEPR